MQKTTQQTMILTGIIAAAAHSGCGRSSPQPTEVAAPARVDRMTRSPTTPEASASSPAAVLPRPSGAPETKAATALTGSDIDYLRWLAAFDTQRQHFNEKQQQSLAAITAGPNASSPTALQQFSAAVQRMAADYAKDAAKFQQRQPPPACVPVAAAYSQYLTAMSQKMAQAASATAGSGKTPQDQALAVLSALTGRTAIDINQVIFEFSGSHPDAPPEFRQMQVH